MNQHKHSLDDFLKKQVEEADFTYREDYWNQMSDLLDEEEKKKKYPFFWRGLSIFLVLLTIGGAAYLLPKLSSSKKETVSAPISQTSISDSSMSLPSVKQDLPQENSTSTSDLNSSTDNNTSIPNEYSNPSSHSVSPAKANTNTNSNTSNQSSSNTNSVDQVNDESGNQTNQMNNRNQSTTQSSPSSEKKVERIKKSKQAQGSTNSNARTNAPISNSSANIPSVTTSTQPPVNTSVAKANPTQQVSSEAISKKKDILTKTKLSKKNKKIEHSDVNEMAEKSDDLNAQVVHASGPSTFKQIGSMKATDTTTYLSPRRDESVYNPRYIASLRDYVPVRMDSVTVITYKPTASILNEIAPAETSKSEYYQSTRYRFRLMLTAGLNANKGLKGNISNATSLAFSPYVGLGVDRQVSNRLTLSSHIGFTYFNGLNSQYVVNSYQYGFGLDSSSVSILHKKLLQLYLPFSMYYQISRNHYLLASIGASYGMDVSSQVNETSMSSNTGWNSIGKSTQTTTSTKASGYRTGFNQFDMYAQLGYSYRVGNQLMIQASIQQGFFDMTKNTYFNNTKNDTQTRLSIGIKYNFKRN